MAEITSQGDCGHHRCYGSCGYQQAATPQAPTADEIERLQADATRLDWMSAYEARIGWNREGDMCRVWVREDDTGDFVPVSGWKIAFEDPRSAIDAAMFTCDSSKRRVDVAAKLQERQDRNAAELVAALNTARGAVRELEQQVFALQQQRDVLQTCIDSHQRDIKDPPGYLQDAVIRAAGLGALHEQRDAAVKERDALRAKLDGIEAQEPVAKIHADGYWTARRGEDPLSDGRAFMRVYARPVATQAEPDGARFRWLCGEHLDAETRKERNRILYRMHVVGYAETIADIDAAMLSCKRR